MKVLLMSYKMAFPGIALALRTCDALGGVPALDVIPAANQDEFNTHLPTLDPQVDLVLFASEQERWINPYRNDARKRHLRCAWIKAYSSGTFNAREMDTTLQEVLQATSA